jgi:tRNA (adenine57-N1/adenine58-N1)-methyltransferase
VSAPEPRSSAAALADRDAVLLIDRKDRTYLRTLKRGGRINVRGMPIACDLLIGQPEGATVATPSGERLLVLRPTYAQLIPSLPRQAQPIYPKDVGPLILWAGIVPGDTVLEIGTGPAALTLALLNAVGPEGRLVSYELREDFAEMARDNVARFHGPSPNWTVRVQDALAGHVDRIVVDLAEPWQLLPHAAAALRPGGSFTGFVPTALQVKSLVDALRADGRFGAVEAFETMLRHWHIGGRSLRPEHRMVAHTGFLVFARRLAEDVNLRSELTPRDPYGTDVRDGRTRAAGPARDDEGGDPPEGLEDD